MAYLIVGFVVFITMVVVFGIDVRRARLQNDWGMLFLGGLLSLILAIVWPFTVIILLSSVAIRYVAGSGQGGEGG